MSRHEITLDKIAAADEDKHLRSLITLQYGVSNGIFQKMQGNPLSDIVEEAIVLGYMSGLRAQGEE